MHFWNFYTTLRERLGFGDLWMKHDPGAREVVLQ